ncbi:MAG: hypothetical protein AAGL66_07855 [Pseudomonadota bacterium]
MQSQRRTGIRLALDIGMLRFGLLLLSVDASAQPIVPLVNGTTADAEVLNENFQSLSNSINEVEERIKANDVSQVCAEDQFLDSDGDCNRVSRSGICEAGRLCTGGHQHVLEDLVEGDLDIGSGDYTHDPRVGRYDVSGAALSPDSHTYQYEASAAGWVRPASPSSSFYGSAPVDLPDGAAVTSVITYWYDNVPNDLTQIWSCAVYRRPRLSTDTELVLDSTRTGGAAGTGVIVGSSTSANLGTEHIVNKQDNVYWLRGFVLNTDGTSNYRFYGCGIRYSYTNTNR